jgi:hypothetical protein
MLNKQDYINAIYQDIDIVRGDTLIYNFQVQGLNGVTPYIIFSCAENYNYDPIFTADTTSGEITLEEYDAEKDIATYSVVIVPNKTKTMDLGRYYYDLELSTTDDVITLMRGRLTLVYGVTN